MRFIKKLIQVPIVWRTLVCFIALGLVFLASNTLSHRLIKQTNKQNVSSLNLILHENLIILDEFRLFNTKGGNAPVDISHLKTSLEDNLKLYESAKDNSEILSRDDGLRSDIEKAINTEKANFTLFSEAYKFYSKTITYLPSDDLGALSPTDKHDELQTRLTATINSLSSIRNGQPLKKSFGQRDNYSVFLTSNTKQSLDSSLSCFNQADNLLKAHPVSGFKEKIEECSSTYESVRINAMQDCLDQLKPEELAKNLSPSVQKLDQTSKKP